MVQPFASNGRQRQPLFTLSEYPLPDGSWSWLSAEWMIDMRDGNVQHDGFEYNWSFGGKKWRSKAGRFNTGALVRRRRWARLMVRPTIETEASEDEKPEASSTNEGSSDWDSIWKGDEGDWKRCHAAIRSQDGDGRKLELWEEWIGHRPTGRANAQRKQWTEDSDYLPSELARDVALQSRGGQSASPRSDAISIVLRQHVSSCTSTLLNMVSYNSTKGNRNSLHFHLSLVKNTIYADACDLRTHTRATFR